MRLTQPIRSKEDINKLKIYFIKKKEYRNYLLLTVCLNTALRISDVLNIQYGNIYDYNNEKFKKHLVVTEKKTGKEQMIYINNQIISAFKLTDYKSKKAVDYVFANKNNLPISRIQVNRILDKAAKVSGIDHISCHSLRKTFGYYAWKEGAEPALLMQIFNHSSFEITKRYIGICQDNKDMLFSKIEL